MISIKDILKKIEVLPPINHNIMDLLSVLKDENSNLEEVMRNIQIDL